MVKQKIFAIEYLQIRDADSEIENVIPHRSKGEVVLYQTYTKEELKNEKTSLLSEKLILLGK